MAGWYTDTMHSCRLKSKINFLQIEQLHNSPIPSQFCICVIIIESHSEYCEYEYMDFFELCTYINGNNIHHLYITIHRSLLKNEKKKNSFRIPSLCRVVCITTTIIIHARRHRKERTRGEEHIKKCIDFCIITVVRDNGKQRRTVKTTTQTMHETEQ